MKQTNFNTKAKDNSNKSGAQRDRELARRKAAEERQAAYAALSLEERLEKAKAAPGNSSKEIARLEHQIAHGGMQQEVAVIDVEEAAVKKAFKGNPKGKTKKSKEKT